MELDKSVDTHSHSITVPGPTVPSVSLLLLPGQNELKKLLKKKLGVEKRIFLVFHFITIGYHIFGVADSVVIVGRLNETI